MSLGRATAQLCVPGRGHQSELELKKLGLCSEPCGGPGFHPPFTEASQHRMTQDPILGAKTGEHCTQPSPTNCRLQRAAQLGSSQGGIVHPS